MQSSSLAAIVVSGLLLLGLWVYFVYNKLSLSIDRLRKEFPKVSANIFAQTEALLALQKELRLEHALPVTRGWAASPDFLRVLMTHALSNRPRNIVECSSGASTIVLARCMQLLDGGGHVFSLEHEPEFAEATRRLLRDHGLSAFATVYDSPLTPVDLPDWSGKWYSPEVLPADLTCDMLVIDGPPWFVAENPRYPAVPQLHRTLRPQGVIFLDDANRLAERLSVQRWLKEFPDLQELRVPTCEKGCVALRKSVRI